MCWKATRYICVGSDRILDRHAGAEREHGEERAGQDLEGAEDDPAGPGGDQRRPPGKPAALALARQEAEEVDLLADLRDQREDDRRRGAEQQQVEGAVRRAVLARVAGPVLDREHALRADEDEGQDLQHDPERLGPELEAADEGDAVGDQRDHQQGADQIADAERHAEAHLQRQRHDRRLDREEDEGEGRIDQRGDGRADIAEAGAAGEQVDVDAVFGGVIGDRQAGEEDDHADDRDRQGRVGEAVVERDRAADGLERQKGDRANSRIGDPQGRPAPGVVRGETKREVLERLVGDPLVIVTPDPDDPLLCTHGGFPWPASGRDLFFFGPLLPDYVAPQYSRTVSSSPALPSAGNRFVVSALVSSGATVRRTCR